MKLSAGLGPPADSNKEALMKKTLSLVLAVLMAISAGAAFAAGGQEGAAAGGAGTVFMGTAIRSLENPYHAVWARGGQAFADSVGGTHVIQTCEGSSEKQLNDIKALVAKAGKDAVFCIDPNESPNIIPIAKALEAAGVYYVSWWNKPDGVKVTDYPHWVAHIAFDGISAGEFEAEALIKTMGGKGNIVALKGMLANSVAIDRFKGLENVLKKYPNVKLLAADTAEWDRAKAFEKTTSFLAAYPNQINGVWAANDNMALGALEALRRAGLAGKVLVTGCDGIQEMLEAVAAGEAAATVLNDSFWQGGIGLALAYAAKTGKIDVAKTPAEKRAYFARAVEVDQSNVKQIIDMYVKGTPKANWTDLYANYVRPMTN
jgi:ribose transport system substrate-binding protein